jgi:hypothetical protein
MEYIVAIIIGIIVGYLFRDFIKTFKKAIGLIKWESTGQDTKYQIDYESYEANAEKDRKFAIDNPNVKEHIQFHGGCGGCTTPLETGLGTCTLCQYFDAEWNLPNLNNNDKD